MPGRPGLATIHVEGWSLARPRDGSSQRQECQATTGFAPEQGHVDVADNERGASTMNLGVFVLARPRGARRELRRGERDGEGDGADAEPARQPREHASHARSVARVARPANRDWLRRSTKAIVAARAVATG